VLQHRLAIPSTDSIWNIVVDCVAELNCSVIVRDSQGAKNIQDEERQKAENKEKTKGGSHQYQFERRRMRLQPMTPRVPPAQ
jgi:hypothetical protein